jgi:hypothetical protein
LRDRGRRTETKRKRRGKRTDKAREREKRVTAYKKDSP